MISLIVSMIGCGGQSEDELSSIAPPIAESRAVPLTIHDETRIDNYFWLRDDTRSDSEVLALLKAENRYTEAVMSRTEALQIQLFNELAGRLQSEDDTVPIRRGGYLYHREYRAGGEHPVYLRQPADGDGEPEVLLDVNKLSRGFEYYELGNWVVSPDNDLIAYAEDTVSRREYTIRVKSLTESQTLPERIEGVESDIAWANDNKTFFYVVKDPQTLLPYQVWRHEIGTDPGSDVLVYEESDPKFYTSVYKTRTGAFIVIAINSTDVSEIRLIDADDPGSEPHVFVSRRQGNEYRIRHVPGAFYVLTNWNAENFRLLRAEEGSLGLPREWQEVLAHRSDVLIQDMEVFADYIVVSERTGGVTQLNVIDRDTGQQHPIDFHDPAYSVRLHTNPEFDTTRLRFVYSSLTTPESEIEYDMATGASVLLKQDQVLGEFRRDNYRSERVEITARDGTRVPVSLVYRTDLRQPGKNPLYITGYGAYGISMQPTFNPLRLSLLDRGFVYAIAHVRGGQERGRSWYEQGKLQHKRNTFWDFIDVTRGLVDRGYGAPGQVFAAGGSAGGLLMGVIANEAPELYQGIIARVPFVDVITTMLDDSIPLTTGEYSEWGDPREKSAYDYMKQYSPYDRVRQQAYPHMLVTTGLWDSQVQYFEPIKWVQKLRAHNTGDGEILIHIDMTTGHDGASARYQRYRIDALEYAFVLDQVPAGG